MYLIENKFWEIGDASVKHKIRGKLSILLSITLLISLFSFTAQATTTTSNETGTYGGYNYEYR